MLQPYLLELDGKLAGRFFDFHGGMAHSDVIEERPVGPRSISHKHLGAMSYDAMILACGAGMSRSLYKWISDTFDGTYGRRTGAVIILDNHSKPSSRLDFEGALIVSVTLPDLNVSENKDAVLLVKIQPERTRFQRAAAGASLGAHTSALPQPWNVGRFQIQIDGLDCRQVTRIDSLELKHGVKQFDRGGSMQIEPTSITFSDVNLELPAASADGFLKWHQDSVVKGNHSTAREKNGSVEFFAPGSNTPYFSVGLNGLGITAISATKASSFPVKVGMYCGSMTFSAGTAASW